VSEKNPTVAWCQLDSSKLSSSSIHSSISYPMFTLSFSPHHHLVATNHHQSVLTIPWHRIVLLTLFPSWSLPAGWRRDYQSSEITRQSRHCDFCCNFPVPGYQFRPSLCEASTYSSFISSSLITKTTSHPPPPLISRSLWYQNATGSLELDENRNEWYTQ
jgi:hypothetical protein